MSVQARRAFIRIAGALGVAGPKPEQNASFRPRLVPTIDMGAPMMRTRVINATNTVTAGNSDLEMIPIVGVDHTLEVFAWFAEITSGDNTFDNLFVADEESVTDPMIVDEFVGQTSRVFSANKGPMNFWLSPGDSVGHLWGGDGVATTTIRHRLWVRRWLWEPE